MELPNGGPPQVLSALDVPLPTIEYRAVMFRISTNDARTEFELKFTPVAPIGGGQFSPTSDHHHRLVFDETMALEMVRHYSKVFTPEQCTKARAMFSDITLPDTPKIEMP